METIPRTTSRPAEGRLVFPDGFLWGASTSAHQVEGGCTGNDWWRFEKAGRVAEGTCSGRACDHFGRYEEDFDLAVGLGHNAHRISVEWSRIEPAPGVIDASAVDHYRRVLQALEQRGLATFVTLHHFTNPLWFADEGGWTSRSAPSRFERYATTMAEALGPHADFWLTLNEPTSVASHAYIRGSWPPGRRGDVLGAVRCLDTMAEAHVLGASAIRRTVPGAKVGFANICVDWRPLEPRSAWQRLQRDVLAHWSNHRFADAVRDELDFIGVQYYHTSAIGWRPLGQGAIPGVAKSDMGWDIVPEGLRAVVLDLARRYRLPLYVTENGLADADDSRRPAFIRDHLRELSEAIAEGADVRGYLHWSLLDNFEWAHGFGPRFGLVEVDYETLERRPRPSAHVYKRIIEEASAEEARTA